MGEEISIGIRAWTHGYDLYAPQASVLFHEYAQHNSRRHNVPKFWEQTKHRGAGRKSLQRLTALIGMAPPGMSNDWDRTKASEYGLGTARPVELFYKMVLVDVANCVEINQCFRCTRQFFTKSCLGDDAAVLAPSSGKEPASPRHRACVASMALRRTR